MQTTRSNNTPFWSLLIGIVLILMSKSLLTEGMFFDGVTYASISRNMAEGQGTFWNPHYTQTLYPEFRQHPPLALGMEALCFKAFGDHLFVERLYSVLTFLLSGLLIALIWKRMTNNIRWAWIPLLFWVAMPVVTWCATNNMLENTMTVFVLFSVYLMIVSYQRNERVWLFLAGISLFAAFLSKGFTGLFPLVFPIIYCIFDDKRRWIQGPVDTLLLLVTLAVLSGVMFLVFPPSFGYLKDYINLQVIGGGLHEATVNTRFFIVFSLLLQLVAPLVIFAIILILSRVFNKEKHKVFEFPPDKKCFLAFLILGLVGVLPMMVSVKQRDFYMLAALPFFALAFGHLSLSMVTMMLLEIKPNVRKWMLLGSSVMLLLGIVLNVCHIGKYGRDEAFLVEMKKALLEIPENEVIGIKPEDFTQWSWHAYFMRYGKVSLDDQEPHKYSFSYTP
jgi:4-amino-4-deoxy-L-arabinose transferase-like glycosyltransferase